MPEQLIEHSSLGFATVTVSDDLSNRLETVNPALAAIAERTPADLIGRPVADIVFSPDTAALEADLLAVLVGAATGFTREVRVTRRNRAPVWTTWLARVLPPHDEVRVRLVLNVVEAAASPLSHARLHRLAYQDRLTGLPNRAWLEEEIGRLLATPRDLHRPGAILLIDLDDLKAVNDALGHQSGDRHLAAAAGAMLSALRPHDSLGRFGGDEFVALLPDTDLASATAVARAMTRRLGGRTVATSGTPMTASIGIVTFPIRPEMSVGELIGCADAAMYRAKGRGKNDIVAMPPPALPARPRR